MKIFTLNTSFQPGITVKNFDSFVWVERYQASGDFQLVVQDDISVLTALPLGVLISHTDTTEVMIVENQEIDRDSKKKLKVTISGRSFETFSENRTTAGSTLALTTGGVTNIETTAVESACTTAMNLLKTAFQPGVASSSDAITNVLSRLSMRVMDPAMAHVIKRGSIYARLLEFLALSDAGIKTIRPNGAQTTMDLVVSDGLDKRASIIFYAQYEDLDDAKYFWSVKTYKNYAMIAAKIYSRLYRQRDLVADVTGLDRRIFYVESNDLEGNYTPPTASDVIASLGQSQLDDHPKISLVTAKISTTAKPKFKFDYDVGDIVTVFGEFATAQTMRVIEHTLSVDSKGMIGYPSLSIL